MYFALTATMLESDKKAFEVLIKKENCENKEVYTFEKNLSSHALKTMH